MLQNSFTSILAFGIFLQNIHNVHCIFVTGFELPNITQQNNDSSIAIRAAIHEQSITLKPLTYLYILEWDDPITKWTQMSNYI